LRRGFAFAPPVGSFYGARVPLGLRLALAGFACATLCASVARAQEPPPGSPPDEIDPEAGLPRGLAPDWRTGHFLLSGRFGLLSPTGNAAVVGTDVEQQNIAVADLASAGMLFGGTLGFGISRHGVIEATVDYGRLGAQLGCPLCSGTQLAIGLGVSYHMAQGVAIDPWVSYGFGVRFSSFKVPNLTTNGIDTQTYRGIDIARLALGADFYPTPFLGLGPFIEADLGTNVKFPFADYGGSVYAMLTLGVRVTLDPLRSSTRAKPHVASVDSATDPLRGPSASGAGGLTGIEF
jgi:hypothetical protein